METGAVEVILKSIVAWASSERGILGVLLIGSRARGTARSESDVDLVILSENRSDLLKDRKWLERLGKLKSTSHEDWGAVKTIRVFFEHGPEVEFNFADSSWASFKPIDHGTFRVVSEGARVLYDPNHILKSLLEHVKKTVG